MKAETLAQKLGTTSHLSPLLRKAARFGLASPRALEDLAIQRGCDYYHEGDPAPPPSVERGQFSDEELAIALLHSGLRYHPQTLRLGAAMLGAKGNDPVKVAWLARLERCQAVVRYVAEAGRRFEPENHFWHELLDRVPPVAPPKDGVLPHPTRFVAMTGLTRAGPGIMTQWIRPRPIRE